ncbi:DUF456 domain-containing protein [Bacteroidales bacterium OttesenSCG-928-M06]|nr:DUF456 domain-containing protein [Bacteroidales bacterium OttesenSCG-928-M06]
MDILLIVIAFICIVIGFVGCILPGLPGPPLSYLGLLLLEWSKYADYSITLLLILAGIVLIITIVDYIFPIYMTKKFGGTRWGMWGATIGLIIGMLFFGLAGTIIGPFIGALVLELIGGSQTGYAVKSATGSLVGFILGTGGKFAVSGVITFYFLQAIWQYWAN